MLALMVIGQLSLMLQIDKKLTSDDLSILIFNDRLTFCTLEQTLNYELNKKNSNPENFGTWINYHNIKRKNNKCILFESEGVIVPQKLFDEKYKVLYLSLSDNDLKNKEIQTKLITSNEQVLVFSKNRDWSLMLNQLSSNIEISHFAAELIPLLSEISSENIKKSVFIHLRKNFFDLFIYQGPQLLLFNSFPHENEEEFLYYLFFVLEQFYLKANQFVAIFLGKFLQYEKYYNSFLEFHNLTSFTYPENLEIDSNHSAPFFNYFYNCENNIRKI